jgi:hypothetical protein
MGLLVLISHCFLNFIHFMLDAAPVVLMGSLKILYKPDAALLIFYEHVLDSLFMVDEMPYKILQSR